MSSIHITRHCCLQAPALGALQEEFSLKRLLLHSQKPQVLTPCREMSRAVLEQMFSSAASCLDAYGVCSARDSSKPCCSATIVSVPSARSVIALACACMPCECSECTGCHLRLNQSLPPRCRARRAVNESLAELVMLQVLMSVKTIWLHHAYLMPFG